MEKYEKKIAICLIAVVAIVAIAIFLGCILLAPTAKISVTPTRAIVGENVSFSGVDSTDLDGTITSYKWDFDDGTTASGATIAHSYSIPGTYIVKLTVIDNYGLSGTVLLPMKVGLTIQIKVNSTTWLTGKKPFEAVTSYYSGDKLYRTIKEKFVDVGFEVISNESGVADTMLIVDYKEEMGSFYSGYGTIGGCTGEFGGYGTDIKCTLKLRDRNNNIVFEKELKASTPEEVRYTTNRDATFQQQLYEKTPWRFNSNVYFKYCGEIIASKYLFGDEISLLIPKLNDETWWVREGAAEALGEIADVRAVEALTEALKDEDKNVQEAAKEALEKIKAKKR